MVQIEGNTITLPHGARLESLSLMLHPASPNWLLVSLWYATEGWKCILTDRSDKIEATRATPQEAIEAAFERFGKTEEPIAGSPEEPSHE